MEHSVLVDHVNRVRICGFRRVYIWWSVLLSGFKWIRLSFVCFGWVQLYELGFRIIFNDAVACWPQRWFAYKYMYLLRQVENTVLITYETCPPGLKIVFLSKIRIIGQWQFLQSTYPVGNFGYGRPRRFKLCEYSLIYFAEFLRWRPNSDDVDPFYLFIFRNV